MNIPEIPAKTIISAYTDRGWFDSNYNMNIYKGCSHGCIYCDSRSECYRVENFDMVRVKENASAVIERDLKSKRKKGMIMTGAMSDAYNPLESRLELTRSALRLIDRFRFGFAVNTKSDLVLRDMELIKSIQTHSPVAVNVTVTSADDSLSSRIERNVCVSGKRFDALKTLADNGIPCGILLMPLLPFINDTKENVLGIVNKAYESGVKWIYAGFGVTLRQNQRDYFYMWLDELFSGLKEQYIRQFGNTYSCYSPYSDELWQVFSNECRRLGIIYEMKEIIKFIKRGYETEQLSLF